LKSNGGSLGKCLFFSLVVYSFQLTYLHRRPASVLSLLGSFLPVHQPVLLYTAPRTSFYSPK
jgi:hypothetical protein